MNVAASARRRKSPASSLPNGLPDCRAFQTVCEPRRSTPQERIAAFTGINAIWNLTLN
jgi:hypothetical protein